MRGGGAVESVWLLSMWGGLGGRRTRRTVSVAVGVVELAFTGEGKYVGDLREPRRRQ